MHLIRLCIVLFSLITSLNGITFKAYSVETSTLLPEVARAIETDKRSIVDGAMLRRAPEVPGELFIGKLAKVIHTFHTQPRTPLRCCTLLAHSTEHDFPLVIAYRPFAKTHHTAVEINYPFRGKEYAAAFELILDFILADPRAAKIIADYIKALVTTMHSDTEEDILEFFLPLKDQLDEFKQALLIFASFPQVQHTLKTMGFDKELSTLMVRKKHATDPALSTSAATVCHEIISV